jgi:hypothetical protein
MSRSVSLALIAALMLPGSTTASIGVTFAPFSDSAVRVDARGNAEVSWTANGARHTVLVPPTGRYLPGGTLTGPDVSQATTAVTIPYRLALRRTSDGRYWALQGWQTGFDGPLELRFSRWRGAPTLVTLAEKTRILVGRATFHGRPVFGTYRTNAGTPIPLAAQLDCFACAIARGKGWHRFNGVRTRADGSFGSGIRRDWRGKRYRATIVGPNIGATLAPDGAAVLHSSA